MFDLVVKHILPGMGLFFYFVLHFNFKFAGDNIHMTYNSGKIS
ncbi:transposase family protein [Lactiplantibacillus plantarum]|nr:transposase family protein [Lactiplantibacillus plantarum]